MNIKDVTFRFENGVQVTFYPEFILRETTGKSVRAWRVTSWLMCVKWLEHGTYTTVTPSQKSAGWFARDFLNAIEEGSGLVKSATDIKYIMERAGAEADWNELKRKKETARGNRI